MSHTVAQRVAVFSLSAAMTLLFGARAHAQLLNYGDPVVGLSLSTSLATVGVSFTAAQLAPSGAAPDGYTLYAAASPGGPSLAVVTSVQPGFQFFSVPPGTYWVRVIVGLNRQGPATTTDWKGITVSNNGCAAAPAAPTNLRRVFVEGTDPLVELRWNRDTCTTFGQMEVGSASGQSNVLVQQIPVGDFRAVAPAGVYFVRMRAGNQNGLSSPSNEIVVTVGGCVNSAPSNLSALVQGHTVTLSWTPAPTGTVQGYYLYAGSSPGTGTLVGGTRSVGLVATNVPSGTYYVTIRGQFPCNPPAGPPSNEILVVVP